MPLTKQAPGFTCALQIHTLTSTHNQGVPRAGGEHMKCLLKRRRESRLGFKIIQTGGEGIMTCEGLGVRVLQLRDGKFITLFDFLKIFMYLAVSGRGCVTWDLSLQSTNSLLMWAQQLWHVGFAAPWHMPSQFPCRESNPTSPALEGGL